MPTRKLPFLLAPLLLFTSPCLARQAARQDSNSPLFPPSLISTAGDALAGLTLTPVPSIPFSGTIEVENRTISKDGNIITHRLRSQVARDRKGRTRSEVDLNVLGEAADPQAVTIHIFDPVTQAVITLFPSVQHAMHWVPRGRARGKYAPEPRLRQPPPSKLRPTAPIDIHHEELGMEVLEGMKLRHGRETTRFPAGLVGNNAPYTITTDYWFSQALQTFVLVKRHGPGNSTHTMTLREINRQEPDPSLFRIPEGYQTEETVLSEFPAPALL